MFPFGHLSSKKEKKLYPDIMGILWVFSKAKFSSAHLISINIFFYLNGIMYFDGTWFYPMSFVLLCTVLIIKMVVLGYYKKNFVGFCCNIFMDHLMPEADNYDEECLIDPICHSASVLYYLHKKRDISCFGFSNRYPNFAWSRKPCVKPQSIIPRTGTLTALAT